MPKLDLEDTIAALSTPPGEGGIAIIRVSGKKAISLAQRFFIPSRNRKLSREPTHTIHHGHWVDEKENLIDEVLVHLFKTPHSYTGEDVVEICCHGGTRLTARILELLIRNGARHAEPGEFTKRAFLHGKLDLTQAEAVLDLIRAKSETSLEAAVLQLRGRLSEKINHFKTDLMKIYAHLEASLDFPDEHLDTYSEEELLDQMTNVRREIESLIASFKRGLIMREGILTVIVGRTNVGKSSLLNALLDRERALVSQLPGTTRDALEETIEIGGVAVRLVDTAGLGLLPKDELDQMGMKRTRSYAKDAGLLLFLVDGSQEWSREDEAILSEISPKNFLFVINKTDLPQKLDYEKVIRLIPNEKPCLISCLNGTGLLELEERIKEKINQAGVMQQSLTLTRLRHKQALEEAEKALKRSQDTLQRKESAELVLVDLKAALDALRELVGEIHSENLLDVIFQEFCIGK
ncbi:MAG: tRNA uridine-5-carboxymethylaminomethyl(34) synthesis GTPase MnmE [Candidatus Omnitrophica bacterium]|nr:tRNA uridine-5-carboxymethylaminomethyl(34) synthesis GTPase MnmE [Candidatus Omnitrophota bacterium]